MKDVMAMVMENKEDNMVVNDLSDKKTIAASGGMLEKAGITKFARENSGTGMLYFLDGKTKHLISKVSLAESNEPIDKAYQEGL